MSNLFLEEAKAILLKKDPRKVIICGPCSIHDMDEALIYAEKLKKLSDEVSDKFFVIMRCFIEKPRTHTDWKGFLYDPMLDGSNDIELGIEKSLKLFSQISKLNLPIAMEFIDPNLAAIFAPHVTWGFIGARTTRSPVHRQIASNLQMPIGFKNPLDGDLSACINAQAIASLTHKLYLADERLHLKLTQTSGNPFTHTVLRGHIKGPNYMDARELNYPIMIDCAHGNSQKNLKTMKEVFIDSVRLMIQHDHIFGLMLESYLESGSQELNLPLLKGLSVTDPCISFEETYGLIRKAYELMSQSHSSSGCCLSSFNSTGSLSTRMIGV